MMPPCNSDPGAVHPAPGGETPSSTVSRSASSRATCGSGPMRERRIADFRREQRQRARAAEAPRHGCRSAKCQAEARDLLRVRARDLRFSPGMEFTIVEIRIPLPAAQR